MKHHDHVNLLRGGVNLPGGIWADLGSGTGAFTLALADLLGADGTIYSLDRDAGALREQERIMRERFPAVTVHYQRADFTQALDLPPLDGIVMANSLHFHRDKLPILRRLRTHLKPGGHFILVEYNADSGNTWVPYPLSYGTWARLAGEAGFSATRQLAAVPSRFLGEIYSAVSVG
ncbi:MAG: class I SAM-dependent methyltransferase [Anaerolineae bacterium]|nr:class I SAM-dependent methyltransferase [Anaerolineae bacterium]